MNKSILCVQNAWQGYTFWVKNKQTNKKGFYDWNENEFKQEFIS